MNYQDMETASAEPIAKSMIETFRAIGYSLEAAVADIIDNSISAKAKNIYINRIWRGGQSVITIKDDGVGMNSEEIIQAMRPGAQNPLDIREKTDLGRFGLGLKTASFSQCRKLSVLSKKLDYAPCYWSWDLDYVAQKNKWDLIKWMPKEFENELDNMKTGTLVVWSDMDRVLPLDTSETNESAKQKFSFSLERVCRHIEMTFHRFIESKNITIYWGGAPIKPWNPFCPEETAVQNMPVDYLPGGAEMKGYILPHKASFSSETAYNKAEGLNGWGSQQGFYIYRGNRLLLAGDWLGIRRKEEHCKLVRISIDLPNTLDTLWQIDIKKSKAFPPTICQEQLKAYSTKACSIGIEVFRHRGRILKRKAGSSFQSIWLDKKKDSNWTYVINRDHDIIQSLKVLAKTKPDEAVEQILKIVETFVPTRTIYINEAQGQESTSTPQTTIDLDAIKNVMTTIYNNLLSSGKPQFEAKEYLKTIEPFNLYEDLIDKL